MGEGRGGALGGALGSTLVALAAVCVLAVGLLRLLGRPRPQGDLRVTARLSLEPRRSLYLVEVAGRCLLLGGGDGGVSLLLELDRDRATAAGQGMGPAERPELADAHGVGPGRASGTRRAAGLLARTLGMRGRDARS